MISFILWQEEDSSLIRLPFNTTTVLHQVHSFQACNPSIIIASGTRYASLLSMGVFGCLFSLMISTRLLRQTAAVPSHFNIY